MNQILNINFKKEVEKSQSSSDFNSLNIINKKRTFQIQFYLSIIIIFFIVIFYIFYRISINLENNSSQTLMDNYQISKLYSNNNLEFSNYHNPYVIGIIEIPSLNIIYPVFSDINDELLKTAPCKFYGEMPGINSNLCIAAHNYDNSKFFSNIFSLNIGDEIIIYNETNEKYSYYVFDKFEINPKNSSIVYSSLYDLELTLLTCNNSNNNRFIIKAKVEDTY